MEDRSTVLRCQPAGGNALLVSGSMEREVWSTPILIGLNAAAGTDTGTQPGLVESATNGGLIYSHS